MEGNGIARLIVKRFRDRFTNGEECRSPICLRAGIGKHGFRLLWSVLRWISPRLAAESCERRRMKSHPPHFAQGALIIDDMLKNVVEENEIKVSVGIREMVGIELREGEDTLPA